ncbi:MAG: hypothetical protein O3B08_01220 [Proteobacteria bacterium]|nr:hypothetical protein [Pseudomonadota bacterium]
MTAVADPGALPRILELFAKRGLVPAQMTVTRTGPDGDGLHVNIRMPDMEQSLAIYIGECLRAMFCVEEVFVSELQRREVA